MARWRIFGVAMNSSCLLPGSLFGLLRAAAGVFGRHGRLSNDRRTFTIRADRDRAVIFPIAPDARDGHFMQASAARRPRLANKPIKRSPRWPNLRTPNLPAQLRRKIARRRRSAREARLAR